ncbi:MAG: hypothetical protein GC134_03155 [Proteobacteria bacterium]|nr:hypothetical protein [Pseudomonadota bacterium]
MSFEDQPAPRWVVWCLYLAGAALFLGVILTVVQGVREAANTTVETVSKTDTITIAGLKAERTASVEQTTRSDDASLNRSLVLNVDSLTLTNTSTAPLVVRAVDYAYRGAENTVWMATLTPGQKLVLTNPCGKYEFRKNSCLSFYITGTDGAPLGFLPLSFPESPLPAVTE